MNTEQIYKINLQKSLAAIEQIEAHASSLMLKTENKEVFQILLEIQKLRQGIEKTGHRYNMEHIA